MVSARDILWVPRRRCGCGEIGIRGGLKIHWGFPRCRFESDQPHHFLTIHSDSNSRRVTVRVVQEASNLPVARQAASARIQIAIYFSAPKSE